MSIRFRMQGYLTILIFSSTFNRFASTEKQFLSHFIHKIHQNPYYFYNLNPSFKNPAFKVSLIDSLTTQTYSAPSTYLVNNKPAFSVQIKPEYQLPDHQFLSNNPSNVFYVPSNDAQSTQNQLNPMRPFYNEDNTFKLNSMVSLNPLINSLNTLSAASSFEQVPNRNPLFSNSYGLINENRFQGDFFDHQMDGSFIEQNHHQTGQWCNKQMLELLQPHCFCGKTRMTKNSIICSNVPNEVMLRRTLHAVAILLNMEGIYRISKLKVFNSTIGDLNLQTLPKTLSFHLIQMNKCELRSLDQLSVFHNSVQQLKKMDLSGNELEEFPFRELSQLNGLLILKLSYNHLKSVPDDAFRGCLKLRMLDLSFNQLNYLGNHAFSGSLNLKYLDLRFNQLKVLNNQALAFQQSTILYFINLSNNEMRFIVDDAFENLVVHKLYLDNNRLGKFLQHIFEPILDHMVKINIEQKLFYGDDLSHHGTNKYINNEEISYRTSGSSSSTQQNSSKQISNQLNLSSKDVLTNPFNEKVHNHKQTDLNSQIDKDEIKERSINIYRKHPNISSTSKNNESHINYIKSFDNELDVLMKLNLSDDSLEQLIDDLILDKLFDRFSLIDKKRTRSIDDRYLPFNVSLFESRKSLDTSNSFREEVKTKTGLVFFDDEQEHREQLFNQVKEQSTHSSFENDEYSAAFIQVSDNDFQCACNGFEWLFHLKQGQLRALKGFQCSNLPGQKKFLSIEQLTLSDINCWYSN